MLPSARGIMRILIVEDDPDSRESFCGVLEDAGHECISVKSGKEALLHLRSHPLPDAILLDMLMPEMDGWQFRKAQLADPHLANIPVVVITAADQARNSAMQFGAAQFLTKPVHPDALVGAFRQLA